MPKIDELNKTQLLALADLIISIECNRIPNAGEFVYFANLLGYEIVDETKHLTPLQRITRLGYVVQEIKGELEIEQAVADYQEPENYDNDPGEGGQL